MRNSLVIELQRAAMDSSIGVSDLLRKALVVARKLGIGEFQQWIDKEMNGYKDYRKVPEYRHVYGDIRAHNPYRGWIPLIIEANGVADRLKRNWLVQPIGEIEALIRDGKSSQIIMYFSSKNESEIMRGMDMPFRPALHFSQSVLHGVLNAVRNHILNWSLKLEEEGVLGEEMSFSEDEKTRAKHASQIIIENFQGILGDVKHSNVSQVVQMEVRKGDFSGLSRYLKSHGLSQEDIDELKVAIDSDGESKNNKELGEKTGGWFGKMMSKAASGAWNVTVSVASEVLTKGLEKFFNLS